MMVHDKKNKSLVIMIYYNFKCSLFSSDILGLVENFILLKKLFEFECFFLSLGEKSNVIFVYTRIYIKISL